MTARISGGESPRATATDSFDAQDPDHTAETL
jgi:hypothetical protein